MRSQPCWLEARSCDPAATFLEVRDASCDRTWGRGLQTHIAGSEPRGAREPTVLAPHPVSYFPEGLEEELAAHSRVSFKISPGARCIGPCRRPLLRLNPGLWRLTLQVASSCYLSLDFQPEFCPWLTQLLPKQTFTSAWLALSPSSCSLSKGPPHAHA